VGRLTRRYGVPLTVGRGVLISIAGLDTGSAHLATKTVAPGDQDAAVASITGTLGMVRLR
jgi:sugar (pentulose or hexulose) kinase